MSNKEDIAVPTVAVTPSGINHLVLNVYNMEETHRFWTEIIGLKLVGKLNPGIGYKGQQKPTTRATEGTTTLHSSKIRSCLPSRPRAGACTARRRRSTISPSNFRTANLGSSRWLLCRAEE